MTMAVCRDLGISVRQFDYLRRIGVLPPAAGSGSRYDVSPSQYARLGEAVALDRAAGGGVLPRMAAAVLAAPETPPARGWVCIAADDRVAYGATLSDVVDGLSAGGIVAAFGQ